MSLNHPSVILLGTSCDPLSISPSQSKPHILNSVLHRVSSVLPFLFHPKLVAVDGCPSLSLALLESLLLPLLSNTMGLSNCCVSSLPWIVFTSQYNPPEVTAVVYVKKIIIRRRKSQTTLDADAALSRSSACVWVSNKSHLLHIF